jgi:hypothetical protein
MMTTKLNQSKGGQLNFIDCKHQSIQDDLWLARSRRGDENVDAAKRKN